ncbi:DUF177 domain-containing protein [Rhizobium sp. CRIBSB]|nr:DUF177 domain-containing protein [Rhizobium sp. CRIBSB]
MSAVPPFSEIIRLNQIGSGLTRRLEPDAASRQRIAADVDLQALESFIAEITVAPTDSGWRLSGWVRADAVQTCGLSLEPVPARVDTTFRIGLAEPREVQDNEIIIDLDDDAPDLVEDGKIDLGQYAVEQLVLALDPFPRKPGAEFVPPEPTEERSPFAVLKRFPTRDSSGEG